MSEADDDSERLLAIVRNAEPDASAMRRAIERLDGIPERSSPVVPFALVTGAAAVLALAAWVAGHPTVQDTEEPTAPARAASARVLQITEGVPVTLETRRGQVEISGTATVTVKDRALRLDDGSARFAGRTEVVGPGWTVSVDGTSEVRRRPVTGVQVVIIAGTAETHAAEGVVCTVEDLAEPALARGVIAQPPVERAVERQSQPPVRRPQRRRARSDGLRAQMQAYREARARAARGDRAGALRALESFRRRWPRSTLRPEVDLQVIELLQRTGQHTRAREEARRFLDRHPGSPSALQLRRMTGQGEQ